LKFIKLLKILLFSLVILHVQLNSFAQDSILTSNADTIREIQIIQGNSLREKSIDSATRFQTISGNVIVPNVLVFDPISTPITPAGKIFYSSSGIFYFGNV
jgi:hypothetical protein